MEITPNGRGGMQVTIPTTLGRATFIAYLGMDQAVIKPADVSFKWRGRHYTGNILLTARDGGFRPDTMSSNLTGENGKEVLAGTVKKIGGVLGDAVREAMTDPLLLRQLRIERAQFHVSEAEARRVAALAAVMAAETMLTAAKQELAEALAPGEGWSWNEDPVTVLLGVGDRPVDGQRRLTAIVSAKEETKGDR